VKLHSLNGEGVTALLLALSVLLGGFYVYVYRQESRQAGRAARLVGGRLLALRALRVTAAVLAILALARPAITLVRTDERLPVVPLIVDASASMAFDDARENPLLHRGRQNRFQTARDAMEQLQAPLTRTHRVRVYAFSDSSKLLRELPHRDRDRDEAATLDALFRAGNSGGTEPIGDRTNIADSVADVLHDLAGDKVSGLVLFTDGRQTGGESLDSLVELATHRPVPIPIHTVVLGSEFPLRDLRIDDATIAGTEASLGDVLTFHVKITNQISDSLDTELTLLEADGAALTETKAGAADSAAASPAFKPAGRRKVHLVRGQQTVTISTIPEHEGLRLYRLELPFQPDEINTDNNVFNLSVKVVKRTLRVILIAGQSSREYAYLVPALLRDPVVELSCWLQSADVDYVQQGKTNLDKLPESSKDWAAYDVAILHDVDPNGLSVAQVDGLETMVAKGGGLMIVAGRNQGLAKLIQVHAAKIRGLLPVEIDKNLHPDIDRYYDRPLRAERTAVGKNHPIMLASSDEKTNEQIWASFPQVFWYHPVGRCKPKAVSLLQNAGGPGASQGSQGSEGDCLMAIHRYGEGAVFYCGLDSLWLWRYPAESYDYDRFWTRVIRHLGEARLMGTQQQVSLTTDRGSYSPGEPVQISLRVLDPALMAQLAGQTIYATIAGTGVGNRGEHKVALKSPDGAAGSADPVFRGSCLARGVGQTLIAVRQAAPNADSQAKPLFDVTHGFQVQMQSLENVDTSADLAAMKQLSEATGGQYFDYHNMSKLADLVAAIPADPQVIRRQVVFEVWDGWTFLAIFLVMVSAEWCLRKLWGLL
jgi:hypothetical protein